MGFVNNLRAEAPSFAFDVGDSFVSWKDPLRFDRFSSAPSPLAAVEVVGRADDGFVVEVFEPHPVPDSGRFVDVVGSVFEADVSELARLGVARGCNPPANDRFCPDAPVTRGQAAAILARALSLPAGPGGFSDSAGHVFEGDIAAIAAASITKGCNPPAGDRFCPDTPVTRGQMAAFLVRALRHSSSGAGS